MISNQKLFSVGDFDFRLQHLLVIGILILSISISMLIRSTPMSYGFELFEFDPFFNYRATDYIINNGIDSYFDWIDEKSWHPFGRDVSENSQVVLHLTASILYPIFGFGLSTYNFTILFPLVIGSITSVVVFAFVRVLGGTTAGLLASLIFAISVPIFTRGLVGWFKSEPLGLFLGFIALYLFVSGIKSNKGKISLIKLIFAGLFLSLGVSAWGGILFFVVAIAIYYFAIPFIKNDKNFIIWAIPCMSISLILFSLMFERSSAFLVGKAGLNALSLLIILPTAFVFFSEIIKKFSSQKNQIRNCVIFLASIIAGGLGIILSGSTAGLPTFRYLNAVNPFLTSQDALTDSVSEHMTVQLHLSFALLSIRIVFALIGIWLIFTKKSYSLKNNMRIFILISSILGIYVSSAFVRLELFASFAIIILASIGISILFQHVYKNSGKIFLKLIFSVVIISMLAIPLALPEGTNWSSWGDFSPSIMSGATSNSLATDDWRISMEWLKQNTPENSVIAAWWDYGYWITTLSDRTTIVDNATVGDFQIKKVAYAFTTNPAKAWHILGSDYNTDISNSLGNENIIKFEGQPQADFDKMYREITGGDCKTITKSESKELGVPEFWCNPVTKGLDADYVLIYVAGERIPYNEQTNIYLLEGGGDESKKHWMAKISGQQVSKFIQSDGITPTNHFMKNTLLGNLMPFSIAAYVEPNTDQIFDNYFDGLIPVYIEDIKFNNIENDPFYLVYASPGFYSNEPGPFHTILIYKINTNFQP